MLQTTQADEERGASEVYHVQAVFQGTIRHIGNLQTPL
jgi:hypothetical protein